MLTFLLKYPILNRVFSYLTYPSYNMGKSKLDLIIEDQINKKIADLKEELFNLKFQAALGNIEKPARMNEIKRDIARLKTVLTEKSASKAE